MQIFAPAKINLYLHVTQKLANGYHHLDSLVAFTDIGDMVTITPADSFSFEIDGPLARALKGRDADDSPQSGNLVVQAVWRIAEMANRRPDIVVKLTKTLPLGAGIGGGSSDAAAAAYGLCKLWGIAEDDPALHAILLSLGADVPVCFHGVSARIQGIGDILSPAPAMPEIPIVLAYPGKPCSTVDVFHGFNGDFREMVAVPKSLEDYDRCILFLGACHNDLLASALRVVPDVENVLSALQSADGCELARMSGSGSCCFGLFRDVATAGNIAEQLQRENPDWWVKSGIIGQGLRY